MDSASDNVYHRGRVPSYTVEGNKCDCNSICDSNGVICPFIFALSISLVLFVGPYMVLSFTSTEPSCKVFSMSVSLSNIRTISDSNSLLTADWNISLYVKNNLFKEKLFERVEPRVLYGDVSLARTWLPPFHLYTNDRHYFLVNLTTFSMPINKTLAEGITSDWRNGLVEFTVFFRATFRPRGVIWGFYKKKQMVSCEDIKVAFLPNDTQGIMVEIGKPRKCRAFQLAREEKVTHNPYIDHVVARDMKEGFALRKY